MVDSSKILDNLPTGLRTPLLNCYQEIIANYSEHRWEPAELNGGKFCEVIYSILNGYITGSFPTKPSKPKDMVSACRALEAAPPDPKRVGDRSVRILIPRVIPALYEIRNNRGVGHVGGDVNPNFLDATAVCSMSSWILAELVRIFHKTSTKEAQELVDVLVERKNPLIWDVEGVKRVLDPSMKIADQVLLLLHSQLSWTKDTELFAWVEYSSLSMFRKRILEPFHKNRKIEYDKMQQRVRISPLGISDVEKRILQTRN